MKGLIIGFVCCASILAALVWFFPNPIEGWYDVVYAIFTGLLVLANYGVVKRIIKELTTED